MTPAERRELWDEARPLVRGALWCAGGVLLAAVALYVAFWLPYRDPGGEPPYPVPILPLPPDREPTAEAPPGGYEWVDRKAGVVSIPVEDAMRIAAERIPVRKEAGKAVGGGARGAPTDAGSGRLPPADAEP
jgi:hypothetical protein